MANYIFNNDENGSANLMQSALVLFKEKKKHVIVIPKFKDVFFWEENPLPSLTLASILRKDH